MILVALWVRICICMLCIYASSVSTPGKEFPLTGGQQRGRGIAFTIPVGAKDCSNQVHCISASAALPPQLVVVRWWSQSYPLETFKTHLSSPEQPAVTDPALSRGLNYMISKLSPFCDFDMYICADTRPLMSQMYC